MKLLRRLLALILLTTLIGGFYVAVKGFSGYDPLKVDPAKLLSMFTKKGKEAITEVGIRGVIPNKVLPNDPNTKPSTNQPVLVKFALVADMHNDILNLEKALNQAKTLGAGYVIALGDFTDVGTLKELQKMKAELDKSGMVYYAIPGDHDMWDNKNKGEVATANYQAVFGRPYGDFEVQGVKHILINNANLDSGVAQDQWVWLNGSLEKAKQSTTSGLPIFIFMHQPIYHPTTAHVMGRENEYVAKQTMDLLRLFANYQVSEIISGDIHFYSRYVEPKTQLAMTTVGAVVDERNPQKPRFAMVTVYVNGKYQIDDIEITQ